MDLILVGTGSYTLSWGDAWVSDNSITTIDTNIVTIKVRQSDSLSYAKSSFSWSSYWLTRTPSGLTAVTIDDAQVDLSLTENGTDFDGYSWERSEDNGATYMEFATTLIGDVDTADTTFTKPMILKYRARAYKGTNYSPYTSVVTVSPAGVRVTSDDTHILLADADSEFFFNNAGADQPFSVCAIVKSNSLNTENTLLTRGDVNGLSFLVQLNQATGRMDFAIYAGDSTDNNVIYKTADLANQDTNVNRLVYTYSGNEDHTGMKMYKNATQVTYGVSSAKYGTYAAMNNRAGLHIGRSVVQDRTGNFDLYTLLICDKELSQLEINEFQSVLEDDIDGLSFYANILSIHRFAGNLSDDLDVHDGSSTDPTFFFYNGLVYTGEKIMPSLTETAFQSEFKNFKLGWLICYGEPVYSNYESLSKTADVFNPTLFTAPASVNVAAWATKAAESGKIDYAILTVSHHMGFSLYDHDTAIWGGTQIDVGGGVIVPEYEKYDVGLTGADKNIVPKFISEFNTVGIKPILYYSVYSRNFAGKEWPSISYTNADYQFVHYHNLTRARLQELARLSPYAIWLDIVLYYPSAYVWDLYSSIKTINPNIGVIVNCWTNQDRSDNSYLGFDGSSTEETVQPALPNDAWWTKDHTIGGVTYPCVRELVITSNESYWYNITPDSLRPLAELQAEYDYAKAAAVPIAISISPDSDGIIDEDEADLVASIVL
jgi:hypothetical protein